LTLEKKLEASGRILDTEPGQFLMLWEGKEVTVGGPASSKEDISAVAFSLIPLNREVVKVGLEPVKYNSFSQLITEIDAVSDSTVPDEAQHSVALKGSLILDSETTLNPSIIQEIDNAINAKSEFTLYDKGLGLDLNDITLQELKTVNEVLMNEGINVEKVATGRLEILVRSVKTVDGDREELIQKIENRGLETYLLTIIRSPIQ